MISELFLVASLCAAPARAEDWLQSARRAAAAASDPGAPAAAKPASDWVPYEPASRMFRADLPAEGWTPFEEEDALGTVDRVLGPDDPSGSLRAALTVRLVDRDSPAFMPAKAAVEAMRRQGPGRETTTVSPLRVDAGLARIFEITETRRVSVDAGPSAPMVVHQYVAVIPRGEAYFVVRLVSARENYLDFRDDFVRFLKSLRPIGGR